MIRVMNMDPDKIARACLSRSEAKRFVSLTCSRMMFLEPHEV